MDFKLNKSNLNFRVYAAASLPSTAQENDICVISDVPMKNWTLSPDAPRRAPRTDGDVWIQYSVIGNTINIVKTGAMMVATIAAWQYVNGAWVDCTAKKYRDGEWVNWTIVLWNSSKNYENFNVLGEKGFYITGNNPDRSGSLTKSSDGMVLTSNYGDNIVKVSHDEPIDFTSLSTITVTWSGGNTYANYQGVGIASVNNANNNETILYLYKDNTNTETVTIDVADITGDAYIILYGYNGDLKVYGIKMQ